MSEAGCFLIGPNGAGKTIVSRILANFLSLKFVDSDAELEKIYGKTIIQLWNDIGETAFIDLESKFLNHITTKKNIILATSAYSVLSLENRHLFNIRGQTIYLATNPINQYIRVMLSGKQSPRLLVANNKLQYLIDNTKIMGPLYNSIADFVVDTDNCGIEEVVNKIIDYLHCRTHCV